MYVYIFIFISVYVNKCHQPFLVTLTWAPGPPVIRFQRQMRQLLKFPRQMMLVLRQVHGDDSQAPFDASASNTTWDERVGWGWLSGISSIFLWWLFWINMFPCKAVLEYRYRRLKKNLIELAIQSSSILQLSRQLCWILSAKAPFVQGIPTRQKESPESFPKGWICHWQAN